MKTKFGLVNYQVLLTLFVWCIVDEVRTFNVDDRKPIYFQEEEHAMFGYTVAFIENISGTTSLLVGAPNRTGLDDIKGYGGFYECEINSFTQRGNCLRKETVDYICQRFKTTYKCEDYQMLGATIAVNHKFQDLKYNMNIPRVSVCAPGWKYTLTEKYGKNFTLPVGKCYHFKETWVQDGCESEREYCIPFWKKPDEYFSQADGTDDFALAMGGFSMKYSQDGRYSLVAGPGVKEGRGSMKSHQIGREHIFDSRKDGQGAQYFGFSLTTANFTEHGSFTAGIPNYHPDTQGFTGRVEVFSMADFTMKNALNFGETTAVHFYVFYNSLFVKKVFTKMSLFTQVSPFTPVLQRDHTLIIAFTKRSHLYYCIYKEITLILLHLQRDHTYIIAFVKSAVNSLLC